MNGEFNPASVAIDMNLAELLIARGDTAKALTRLRPALQKDPNNARAKRLIAELEAKKD